VSDHFSEVWVFREEKGMIYTHSWVRIRWEYEPLETKDVFWRDFNVGRILVRFDRYAWRAR
jgi:hypothetical protein